MARIGRSLVVVLLTLAGLFLLTDPAFASGSAGDFSCDGGKAVGKLYETSNTVTTLDMDHLFSFLVGNFEMLSANLMGQMYCGMIVSLAPMVWSAVTLAVVIFGISFTFGIIPMRGSEALKFILKIGLITAFATKSDYLVGTGYQFLIAGIKDGTKIALDGMGSSVNSSEGVYELMDGFIAQGFHMVTDGLGAKSGPEQCNNAVFAVMATMAAAFPMLTYLGLVLLGRIVITFFRAVFAYIYGIVGITFMLTLAPFFLTFALFKQTHDFFDKWLGYIASMALQIVLMFSFLAFVMTMDIKNLTEKVTTLIMYQAETKEGAAVRLPWKYCTLCRFKFIDEEGEDIKPGAEDFITKAHPVCTEPQTPISVSFAIAPDETDPNATEEAKSNLNALLELAGTGLISLIVLAIMVERLLAMIPTLAQRLAAGMGAGYAPQIGGGFSPSGVPTTNLPGKGIIGRFESGFRQSMGQSYSIPRYDPTKKDSLLGGSGDGLSVGSRAIIEGAKAAVAGPKDEKGVPRGGIGRDLTDWLSDPTQFGGGRE